MCSSFTWGIVSIHYLLGLPLAYALRSATPNGLMLLVKLTYSPVILRPIDSFYPPGGVLSKVLHPFTLQFGPLCAFYPSPSRHTVLLYLPSFVCPVAVGTNSFPSLGRPLRLALTASACSMATAHSCSANSFRMYCRTSSFTLR